MAPGFATADRMRTREWLVIVCGGQAMSIFSRRARSAGLPRPHKVVRKGDITFTFVTGGSGTLLFRPHP
jgi:hypothetical protein